MRLFACPSLPQLEWKKKREGLGASTHRRAQRVCVEAVRDPRNAIAQVESLHRRTGALLHRGYSSFRRGGSLRLALHARHRASCHVAICALVSLTQLPAAATIAAQMLPASRASLCLVTRGWRGRRWGRGRGRRRRMFWRKSLWRRLW